MAIEVTTKTGSKYLIDFEDRFWIKISRLGISDGVQRLWDFKVGSLKVTPWDNPDYWEDAELPEIDKHIFIKSKDLWWVSTPVVSVREVEWQEALDTARQEW